MESLVKTHIKLSKYKHVFCDSIEAITWAYDNGLKKKSIIYSSSPAVLMSGNGNIRHLESRWTVSEMKEFQTSIENFTNDIYDSVILVTGISHEVAVCAAQLSMLFQRTLFKAACLTKEDLHEPRLFISIKGEGGPGGNNMNPPWERLLSTNKDFITVDYTLSNNKWSTLTTKGVSWFNRLYIGGVETLIYRVMAMMGNILPSFLFSREVLVPSENELVIETAARLALRGVKITEISVDNATTLNYQCDIHDIELAITPILRKRINRWVTKDLVHTCENIFFQDLKEHINHFIYYREQWAPLIERISKRKTILLSNATIGLKINALAGLCRENNIPVISVQHGVTPEISALHKEVSSVYDINNSDYYLSYNFESKKVAESSSISRGGVGLVAGIPNRHLRMKNQKPKIDSPPIVYISTNIYKGNLGALITWETDYDRAIKEQNMINKVLSNLPHRVMYKTYPEDNRRYSDIDPVLMSVENSTNIGIIYDKVDMRYLLRDYKISISSRATSTLGWQIMSDRPVIFINWKRNSPLTSIAKKYFSKGLFLFNDEDENFYENLRCFLSRPIDEIEELWENKKEARVEMVRRFFSEYSSGAGKRASKLINEKIL
jgi:hypothetical protein